ncbi:MAG TPA: hypothetical protein VGA76_07460, partial [Candidatus Dormibacteraeota bacterium]
MLTRSFSSEDDGQTGEREHQTGGRLKTHNGNELTQRRSKRGWKAEIHKSAGKYGYSSKKHLQ